MTGIDRAKMGIIDGERRRFIAVFARIGGTGPKSRTVLLQNVRLADDENVVLTDHIWFKLTKGFKEADLWPGDVVEFNARVKVYKKGYWGNDERKAAKRPKPQLSYGLERPGVVRKTGRTEDVIVKKSRREAQRAQSKRRNK